MRCEVESLLRAHEPEGDFLESPAVAVTVDRLIAERPGSIIGPYKLLQQIGEGGFCVVYMAEQERPVRRTVALKIIKAGMDTREVIARFEAERQALALMDHPNIAKVLDAGATESGRPYFVMELVKGVPITEFCDRNHMPAKDRLKLFIDVCHAIQHAHHKGVIHRDIKPTNVLVTLHDGVPVVKVIDFGVAKATAQKLTERTLFTAFGQMVGTPAYMSPEQAEMSGLDIDTRSDIYSLGVLLYELLTGTTPLEAKRLRSAGYAEMQRMIREEEPPRPSTRLSSLGQSATVLAGNRGTDPRQLARLLSGDLDWIVMKALEKDRNRRYGTPGNFAEDVERYLADDLVQARPPSSWYRLRKLARRNKRALMTATLAGVILLVALGAVAGSIGWLVRDQEARRTKLASQLELILNEVKQQEAEQKWPEAVDAARRAEALLAGGGGDEVLEKQVRDVLADLTLVQRLEDIWLELAGRTEGNNHEWSDQSYAAAFREYGVDLDQCTEQQAAERLKSRPVTVALAPWLDHWAYCRSGMGNDAGRRKLLGVAGQIDPDVWRRKLRETTAHKDLKALIELTDSENLVNQPAPTLYMLAGLLNQVGKQELATQVLRRAQQTHPEDCWINATLGRNLNSQVPPQAAEAVGFYRVAVALRPHKAQLHSSLGSCLSGQGKRDEAIACYRKAIELDPKSVVAHNNLGNILRDQGKLDEAIECYRQAIQIRPKFGSAHVNLGNALKAQDKLDEAIAAYRKAIVLEPKVTGAYYNLGNALAAQQQLDEAIDCYRKVIELDPTNAGAHNNLGNLLGRKGQTDEAIACYRKAIELAPQHAYAHNHLGLALAAQKRPDEAIECFRKAIELKPNLAAAHYNLANLLTTRKRPDEAVAAYRKAIELNPNFWQAYYNLGLVINRQMKVDEAIAAYRKATELNPASAESSNSLAWLLATCADPKLRKPAEALAAAKKAVELDPNNPLFPSTVGVASYRSGDWNAAITAFEKSMELRQGGDSIEWFFLAMTHWQLGNQDQARQWYDKAVAWMDKNQPDNEELCRFRAEAAELLKIAETQSKM